MDCTIGVNSREGGSSSVDDEADSGKAEKFCLLRSFEMLHSAIEM